MVVAVGQLILWPTSNAGEQVTSFCLHQKVWPFGQTQMAALNADDGPKTVRKPSCPAQEVVIRSRGMSLRCGVARRIQWFVGFV